MVKRPLLSPGSFNPYRPPSIAMSVLAILASLLVGYVPIREYLDYRDFRDNTIPVEATISGISLDFTLHWFLMPAAIALTLWVMVNLFFILQAIEWREADPRAVSEQ